MGKSSIHILLILLLLVLGLPQLSLSASDSWGPPDLFQIAMAFLTNLAIHESGHFIVAESLGAEDNTLCFFCRDKDSLFLGLSMVQSIDEKTRVPYIMGGEIATSLSFEVVLHRYRARLSSRQASPTTYNRALLFFNGTEFLWYSVYAFYFNGTKDSRHDPVAISQETGLSPEIILVIAATQAALNTYRVYSGQDRFISYFTFDKTFSERSASFWIGFRF
jgi:hypothetical protein